MSEMIERLSDVDHERWSDRMRYMFGNWTDENVARWKNQMVTPYADLPEHSKEIYRKKVRTTLESMREPTNKMSSEGSYLLAQYPRMGIAEVWCLMLEKELGIEQD